MLGVYKTDPFCVNGGVGVGMGWARVVLESCNVKDGQNMEVILFID